MNNSREVTMQRHLINVLLFVAMSAVALGLTFAISATLGYAQQQQQPPPSELDVRIGALSQSYKGQLAAAAEREATLTSEIAGRDFKAQEAMKAKESEIERLKKLCGAPCESKKKE